LNLSRIACHASWRPGSKPIQVEIFILTLSAARAAGAFAITGDAKATPPAIPIPFTTARREGCKDELSAVGAVDLFELLFLTYFTFLPWVGNYICIKMFTVCSQLLGNH
jgi:hypothetical protein